MAVRGEDGWFWLGIALVDIPAEWGDPRFGRADAFQELGQGAMQVSGYAGVLAEHIALLPRIIEQVIQLGGTAAWAANQRPLLRRHGQRFCHLRAARIAAGGSVEGSNLDSSPSAVRPQCQGIPPTESMSADTIRLVASGWPKRVTLHPRWRGHIEVL